MRRLAAVLVLGALGAFGLGGCTDDPPAVSADHPGITARGTGTVTGTPDTLTVVLGVQTQGPSAEGALAANNDKANALVDTLKGRGVEAKDIQTSQLSISPTYASDGAAPRIAGYQVTNQVTATLRDLANAGGLIDAAAAAAGDAVRVQQVGFSIDDDSELRVQARTNAVQQAKGQAEQLASAAGVRLGSIRSITELASNGPPPGYGGDTASMSDSRAAPVEPGSQELSVVVDIVYDID